MAKKVNWEKWIRKNLKPDEMRICEIDGKPELLINEAGLRKLVAASNSPNAEAFQHWITREVLPALKKIGG